MVFREKMGGMVAMEHSAGYLEQVSPYLCAAPRPGFLAYGGGRSVQVLVH